MSKYDMTFYDKPFYVDVEPYLVAVRGTATDDALLFYDHYRHGKGMITLAQDFCAKLNENCEKFNASTSKESLQVDNTAKMREALEFATRLLMDATESDEYGDDVVFLVGCMRTVAKACRTALQEPVRNCDRFSKAEVLEMLEDRSFSKEDTIEWLYATKGATDEQK